MDKGTGVARQPEKADCAASLFSRQLSTGGVRTVVTMLMPVQYALIDQHRFQRRTDQCRTIFREPVPRVSLAACGVGCGQPCCFYQLLPAETETAAAM
jgi:hypothetical protein